MIDSAHNIMCASPAYKKEMDMQILQLHDSVINIYDEYLGLFNWPNGDAATPQKLLLTNRAHIIHEVTMHLAGSNTHMSMSLHLIRNVGWMLMVIVTMTSLQLTLMTLCSSANDTLCKPVFMMCLQYTCSLHCKKCELNVVQIHCQCWQL